MLAEYPNLIKFVVFHSGAGREQNGKGMVLIMESGATKTDCCLLDAEGGVRSRFRIAGLNMAAADTLSVSRAMLDAVSFVSDAGFDASGDVGELFFYGAGITDAFPSGADAVMEAFPSAPVVAVYSVPFPVSVILTEIPACGPSPYPSGYTGDTVSVLRVAVYGLSFFKSVHPDRMADARTVANMYMYFACISEFQFAGESVVEGRGEDGAYPGSLGYDVFTGVREIVREERHRNMVSDFLGYAYVC